LIGSALLLIGLGFLHDAFDIARALEAGRVPPLFDMLLLPLHPGGGKNALEVITTAPLLYIFWGVLALFTARGVTQRRRWSYGALPLVGLFLLLVLLAAQLPATDTLTTFPPNSYGTYQLIAIVIQPIFAVYVQTTFLWGLWAIGVALMTYGALRGHLWGGIGLAALAGGWVLLVLFGGVTGSMAIFAALNAALVAYALRPAWEAMETDRFPLFRPITTPTVAQPTATPSTPNTVTTEALPNLDMATAVIHPIQAGYTTAEIARLHAEDRAVAATQVDVRLSADEIARLQAEDRGEDENVIHTAPKLPVIKLNTGALRSQEPAPTVNFQPTNDTSETKPLPIKLNLSGATTPPKTEENTQPAPPIKLSLGTTPPPKTDENAKPTLPIKLGLGTTTPPQVEETTKTAPPKLDLSGLRTQPPKPSEPSAATDDETHEE
jgi:hypothetical protein